MTEPSEPPKQPACAKVLERHRVVLVLRRNSLRFGRVLSVRRDRATRVAAVSPRNHRPT